MRGELIREIPELAAAVLREVRPLPPGDTLYGVIGALNKGHLSCPLAVAEWFRRQLASPHPLGEATEADFLLAFAAILYAATMDPKAVRVSPLAIAGGILGHQRWRKSLAKLPLAIRRLQELRDHYGAEIFTREEWPPPRIETEESPRRPDGSSPGTEPAEDVTAWAAQIERYVAQRRKLRGPPAAPS